MKPLHNLKILDLTQRLPGPLATYHLQNLGAHVYKVEDPKRPDPFLDKDVKIIAPLFYEWYKNLNHKKTIIDKPLMDLQNEFIGHFDAIITTLSLGKMKTLGLDKLSKLVIHLKSDEESTGMHDLNALARLNILSLYVSEKKEEVLNPPFLPVAAVSFSYELALNTVSHLLSKSDELKFIEVTMVESIKNGLCPLIPSNALSQQKHLHNGLFPSYNLYRLKDGHYVALACVEEHYFKNFCEDFKLNLPVEARFDTTDVIFKKLSELFLGFTYEELLTKTASNNYCLSLVQNPSELK